MWTSINFHGNGRRLSVESTTEATERFLGGSHGSAVIKNAYKNPRTAPAQVLLSFSYDEEDGFLSGEGAYVRAYTGYSGNLSSTSELPFESVQNLLLTY